MADKRHGHRQAWKPESPRRRERERRDREPILIPVACADCLRELAEVPPGTEVYCPACQRWASAYAATGEGDLIA